MEGMDDFTEQLLKAADSNVVKIVMLKIAPPPCIILEQGMLATFLQCNFFTGIFRNTQSESYMQSLIECVREYQSNAQQDTH